MAIAIDFDRQEKSYTILLKDKANQRDLLVDIKTFRDANRNHWNIECGLHWKLDVILNEEHLTNKKGNSVENISTIRKIVFNLARLDKTMGDNLL